GTVDGTVGCSARAVAELPYTPTLGGRIESRRVRPGLIAAHVFPPFVVFHTTFEAKKSACGSTVENTSGAVRSVRYSLTPPGSGAPPPRPTRGPTCSTNPVRRS